MNRLDLADKRGQILQTAIDMLGKEKNLRPTVREIASRADVNIAAINYYFGSKKELLDEAEKLLGQMLSEKYDVLEDHAITVEQRISIWADEMMSFILEYPGFLFILGIKVFEQESQILAKFIGLAEKKLIAVLAEAGFERDKDYIAYRAQQLLACVIYPALIQSGVGGEKSIDIHLKDQRKKYLDSVFECVLREIR